MIFVGEWSLWIALVMAGWATVLSFAGGGMRRAHLVASGERGLVAATGFTALAAAGLATALVRHDFSLRYVASHTSTSLPTRYALSALWSGPGGSLLLGALILSVYATIAILANRHRNRELMPWVTGVLAATLLVCLGDVALGANPFQRLDWVPANGRGMNPPLQNTGMALRAPSLYLGYLATTVPFAFAIGALVTRRLDAGWLAEARCWALASWCFLTGAITLGMWSAYAELGVGGRWAWDAVENGSILPWLTGTAFLHGILVQEKRGLLRTWNVLVGIGTFLLAMLATSLTRGGVEPRVSGAAPSPVGPAFVGVMLAALVVSVVLVSMRRKVLAADAELESAVSREAALASGNLLLVAIAAAVLSGTLVPVLVEAVTGATTVVGPRFSDGVYVTLGLALLGLMGTGSLVDWRRSSVVDLRRRLAWPVAAGFCAGASLLGGGMRDPQAIVAYMLAGFVAGAIAHAFRHDLAARRQSHQEGVFRAAVRLVGCHRRRYGSYVAHAGITLVFAALAGLAFRREFVTTIGPGERYAATDPYGHRWSFTSDGLSRFDEENWHVVAVSLAATRDGSTQPRIVSENRHPVDSRDTPRVEPRTTVGILHGLRQDVHVVLSRVSAGQRAEVRITFTPLVAWVWYGAMVMACGGLIVMWPPATRGRMRAEHAAFLAPGPAPAGDPPP